MPYSHNFEAPLNPGAVKSEDRYLIVGSHNRAIESHYSIGQGRHAKRILNEHAAEHNHPITYRLVDLENGHVL